MLTVSGENAHYYLSSAWDMKSSKIKVKYIRKNLIPDKS